MDPRPGLLLPFRRHPIYGGFAHLVPARWVLGVDVHLPRGVSRGPTEPQGTLRYGKMAELRLESAILGAHGPVLRFPFVVAPSTAAARI